MKLMAKIILLAGMLVAPALAAQTALDRLQTFTRDLRSLRADFTQVLYDASGEAVRESGGTLSMARPGRFRWDYDHPYKQQIIADGERLWVYDTELEQVTVRKQKGALGQAPIMLLSEGADLSKEFETRDLGSREGLFWVELKPRVQDTDFRTVYLGLDDKGLKVMELRDNFEQVTQIRLQSVRYNVDTAPDEFSFTPPPGVDVVGDIDG